MQSEISTTDNISEIGFKQALSDRYLSYALSTIMSRSLPDVRDGLKPVHRRILYAMYKLHLDPKANYKKSARVIGDVIGKYHPHGDASVYDALVRLSQDFSQRYPLIDGQGNFGSIDGDNAAAMRYTEAKLTYVAMLLLDNIDKGTIDFRPTYDDSEIEPSVLPAAFPNLLANGIEGIAVGMATSIPPHNILELLDATKHLLKKPEATTADLLKYVKGPDFPTGGEIIDNEEVIRKVYENGRGSLRIRAKWFKEELKHGSYQIVITEIPYQVVKSRLLERIADICIEKKIPQLVSIQDESAQDIRIVITPKNRSVDADVLMERLFKLTELETRFNFNLNVLSSDLVPGVLSLKEILLEFIKHRYDILERKSRNRLAEIIDRLEVLDGLLIAFLNIDEVIRIIRFEEKPKAELIKRFELTERQAEAILNLRLRNLQKLEEHRIKDEKEALDKEKKELEEILSSKEKQLEYLLNENQTVKEIFKKDKTLSPRRTKIINDFVAAEISNEDLVEKEAITVFFSKQGWLRAQGGHSLDLNKIKYKQGDEEGIIHECYTTDYILFFAENGKFYSLEAHKILRGKTDGQPINLIFDLAGDKIINLLPYTENAHYLVTTLSGKGFKIQGKDLISQTKLGKQILNIKDKDKAFKAITLSEENDSIVVVNSNRRMLVIKLSEISTMQRGMGVMLQKQNHSILTDIKDINFAQGLEWNAGNRIRREPDLRKWLGKRGSKGSLVPFSFPKSNQFT